MVVAARTVTSLVRVLDVVPEVLGDDARVTIVFAYDPASAFNDGVLDLLRSLGCRTMPWSQVDEVSPDLVISASENVTAPAGDCPVLVLPHGIGFQKQVPAPVGPGTRLSGLVPEELLASRRAWIALSHPDQAAQLAAAHPGTVGRTVLVGDPCHDRLLAGARWRERYRSALGVRPGQRLVLLSSTWGTGSLIGQHPELPAELLAHLPADEYRVALVLHPNVWSGHGAWQVRVLQRRATEAGLITVDPVDGWQQALLAADLVVGDHGSVTLYGAAAGRPVLLAAFGAEAVAGTASWALRAAAPRLDLDRPLPEQLAAAVAGHTPERYREAVEMAFAVPGESLPRLRETVYDLLRLAPPKQPARTARAFAPVAGDGGPARSLLVRTAVTARSGRAVEVELRRFPAVLARETAETADAFWHLACDVDEPDTRLTESATALLQGSPVFPEEAGRQRLAELLAAFPGARAAALPVADGCLVRLRDGSTVLATGAGPDPGIAAAAVYACLRLGLRTEESDGPDGLVVTLRHGAGAERVVLCPDRPGTAAGQPAASRARTSAAFGLPPSS
ncbi:hypothetical protein [Kitasatospora sp. NPDC088134]|uniref:hypothetical protein n=1 Tax=Kitasatospora sp. NPDC088134 TaxID=3364071 RepID=UPI0037FF7FAB